jgi:hypothetical protein
MSKQRYYLSVENLAQARGQISELSWQGNSPDGLAAALESALREPSLFARWRAMQPDPDAIDPTLGASDADATVRARQSNLHTDVEVTTSLPHSILKHRLGLLIGAHWSLHDVQNA